jgi:uncharacterized protein HemX
MAEEKKQSSAPIRTPPTFNPTPTKSAGVKPKVDLSAPKKFTSKRKRLKNAEKTQKGAFNLRRFFAGLFILLALGAAFYAFTNQAQVKSWFSGKALQKTQSCTVTRVNTTNYFETSCGTLQWDVDALKGGAPSQSLAVGKTYDFVTEGVSIPIAGSFPEVKKVTPTS